MTSVARTGEGVGWHLFWHKEVGLVSLGEWRTCTVSRDDAWRRVAAPQGAWFQLSDRLTVFYPRFEVFFLIRLEKEACGEE
jgi:hypothetical protein